MAEATVTSKGQITIPVEVRRHLGLQTGSRVHFVLTDSNTYEITPVTRSVTALKGVISAPENPVSLADMERAVALGAIGIDPE